MKTCAVFNSHFVKISISERRRSQAKRPGPETAGLFSDFRSADSQGYLYFEKMEELEIRQLGPEDEAAFLAGVESWAGEEPDWDTFAWKEGMSHQEHLKSLGVSEALMSCATNNHVSRKLIEHAGGILRDEILDPTDQRPTLRFRVLL